MTSAAAPTSARILLVEDHPMNLMLFRDLLESRGHRLTEATTVDEARARLREAPPDIVLLDLHIPGGGGELVLREIRASASLAHLPVVAVTANAMRGDRERLLQAGFDGYVSKPIDARSFGSVVESFLDKRHTQ